MKNNSHAFVNQLLVCLLVTICCGGSLGVGLVWIRHQISVTANANRSMTARIREVERQIMETKTRVESAQSPDALRRLNAEFQLGLVPKSDGQVLHVAGDSVHRLMTRANRELFTDGRPPIALSIPLSR
jgi:hypothetical protein